MRLTSHAQQQQSNQTLAKHLATLHPDATLGDVSRQWRMTLYFYAAVHHVEEQLQKKLYPPSSSHQTRKRNLRNVWNPTQPNAVLAYMDLETHSREARYEKMVPTDQELTDAEAQSQEVLTNLI